ncbi:MAG: aminopeptidase P N-terminal domain-containing protein [Alphaproteobacteria bacterium]|nr:aminopeptidase P N-terminal domain-containing protein [Alphaproteobacteria bacterium]MCB9696871.1 aminopeptidase P N-terminal domain-containing protein [Alphaproteobacteria bacterium]
MLTPTTHARRRRLLAERLPGPVLLLGNGQRARNLPMTKLPFRQDSTFLYFTGCDLPDAAALLIDGRCELFLPAPADDDALWHGHVTTLDAIRDTLGVDAVLPTERLEERLTGLRARTLAVADEGRNVLGSRLCGVPLRFGRDHGDEALMDAVIELRRAKGPDEIEQMRLAAHATHQAYLATIGGTAPGGHERGLWTLFEAVLRLHGLTTGYDTILSQSGEILHNPHHSDALTEGRMVLLDGGGELPSGYGVDITRTWPVSGRFDTRQRAAYAAVLEAQLASIALCTPGRRYREVHDRSCEVLARFLVDEKLIRGSVQEALERHAHALFFPHGVGHLIGLDVHDLEMFGDRPSYPPGVGRPEPFGTCYLRLDLPLQEGWVVTVEPGFYVVPAILHDPALRERFADLVDFEAAERWIGFGGIRIEDDVHVTAAGPDVLTEAVPKGIDELEALIGTGPTPEQRLSV